MSPAISVLTPVHNGEQFLAECIESVRAQTRTDWEYLIVDNCSTDRSAEIAGYFAGMDHRIRLVRCTEFVNVHQSFSRTVEFMDPGSRYCKFVCADDLIYPECLEQMVAVAEKYPSVGIVSAYRMYGEEANSDVVLSEATDFSCGMDLLRKALMEGRHGTGSPTTVLYRADVVRRWKPFFDEGVFHSDTDAALRTLLDADFGFVHQVLSVSRLHSDTVTASFADRINTYLGLMPHALVRYGPRALSKMEYRRAMRFRLRKYWWFLFKARLQDARRKDEGFQSFHVSQIRQLLAELSGDDGESRLILNSMYLLLANRTGAFVDP